MGDELPLIRQRSQPFNLLTEAFHFRQQIHRVNGAVDGYLVLSEGIDRSHNGLRRATDEDHPRVEARHLVFQPTLVLPEQFQKSASADVFVDVSP